MTDFERINDRKEPDVYPTFAQAFALARSHDEDEFYWRGKVYHTKTREELNRQNLKPNLWDQLAEVSGWDRTAAKRSIYETISGHVPEPADESLWDTFCDLLKTEPAGLSIMLGQGIRH